MAGILAGAALPLLGQAGSYLFKKATPFFKKAGSFIGDLLGFGSGGTKSNIGSQLTDSLKTAAQSGANRIAGNLFDKFEQLPLIQRAQMEMGGKQMAGLSPYSDTSLQGRAQNAFRNLGQFGANQAMRFIDNVVGQGQNPGAAFKQMQMDAFSKSFMGPGPMGGQGTGTPDATMRDETMGG